MKIRTKRLHPNAKMPEYKRRGSSGLDLYALEAITVPPGMGAKIATGIAMEIPEGFEGQIRPRSGLSAEHRIVVLGTIDASYRGDLSVLLYNYGADDFKVKAGDRIAQIVIAPVMTVELIEAEELSITDRGAGGFGHTGV